MDEKFGKFVRNKREEKKINLRKLAEILEIAPAYMSDMEKARRYPPDKEKLAKIAEALELTEDEAFAIRPRTFFGRLPRCNRQCAV